MAEEKKEFCAFLKAAILDEEKASKEYKEMAENLPIIASWEGDKTIFKNFESNEEREKILNNLKRRGWKIGQENTEVLKKISEDEAKHKLHLEQIEKDLGCKND